MVGVSVDVDVMVWDAVVEDVKVGVFVIEFVDVEVGVFVGDGVDELVPVFEFVAVSLGEELCVGVCD